ncbi:autotransporter outer membrane beta-barrel domain-containing protein [Phascolarctobacterium faecium]|nr:autotransporter outer membrane beta-barrel domain-containing protein [Phascolarctobacterium faecium]MDM8109310.1 autotransporter outer membrane beta-barrel domain-containing protein [Phascolarctobacterium faecium]
MKKKNLEKAVILGLLLSTSIYGTAFATVSGVLKDGTVVDDVYKYFDSNRGGDGGIYIDNNGHRVDTDGDGNLEIDDPMDEVMGGKALSVFKEITVDINNNLTDSRKYGVYLEDFDLNAPTTNFTVNIGTKDDPFKDQAHGIFLISGDGKKTVYLEIGNYTANIYAPDSNAFTMSKELNSDTNAKINGDFTASVSNGSALVVSASSREEIISDFTVNGKTNITISGNKLSHFEGIGSPIWGGGDILDSESKYNPAGIYAGDTEINFEFADKLMTDDGVPIDYGTVDIGKKTLGKAVVNLKDDTNITLLDNVNTDDKAYGIYAGKNGTINVNNLTINSSNKNSIGIAAQNSNLIYDNMIHLKAKEFWIVYDKVWQDTVLDQSENKYGSTVVLNGTNNTITMAEGGKALYADARIEDPNAKDENGDEIKVPEVIIKSGDNGIGNLDVKGDIVATNSGKIDLTVNKAADITGDIEATNSGVINFTLGDNADMIVSEKDNTLINAGGASTLSLAKNGSESKIGNVQAANGGTINLTLGEGAYFAGRVDDYKDADGANGNWNNVKHQTLFDSEFAAGVTKSGTVNMTLNGGVWDLTQQSWVTNLNGNDGVVYLNGNGTGGYAVHIGKLEGEHTFVVNLKPTDYAASDMLYIYDGSSAGVQNLRINNEAEVLNALKDDGDRIRFATVGKTAGAGAGFGDDYVVRGRGVINSGFSIDYVDYDTDTHEGNYNGGDSFTAAKPGDDYVDSIYGSGNNNSETGSQASTLENNAGTGNKPVAELDSKNLYLVRDSSKDAGKSDSGATIINMSRANYKNAIYMDRLNKRMGEMRYVNGEEEQGLWVRLRHDRIGQSGDFRSMNTMYEVGYDVKQPTDNGEHRIGMAIDYMRGSTTYDDIMGKGETKRYGLWLYDTWLGEKGHYTDYIVKWGHLSNDFDIRDKDSLENITGDYSNNVFSVSAEYGKKNDMGNNWYFEPQAQLQLARVTGADYVTTQGSKVNVDGINSLIGRAGFRIGRDMDENSTVYLKADLLHEFMGDQTVTAADATGTLREEFENKGTWYDVGFGFAAKMSKNSYAFMDFEKSFGNDNDETYQINAGMQWSF